MITLSVCSTSTPTFARKQERDSGFGISKFQRPVQTLDLPKEKLCVLDSLRTCAPSDGRFGSIPNIFHGGSTSFSGRSKKATFLGLGEGCEGLAGSFLVRSSVAGDGDATAAVPNAASTCSSWASSASSATSSRSPRVTLFVDPSPTSILYNVRLALLSSKVHLLGLLRSRSSGACLLSSF